MNIKVPVQLKRTLRTPAVHVSALLILIFGLFAAFNYYSSTSFSLDWKADRAKDEILQEGGISADTLYSVSDDSSRAIIARSPRATEVESLRARSERARLFATLCLVGLFLSLAAGGVYALWQLIRYWNAPGADTADVESRRNRVRVCLTIAVASVLTGSIVMWRFIAGLQRQKNPYGSGYVVNNYTDYIKASLTVAGLGVLLVWLVWSLLRAPSSRVSYRVRSISLVYRTAIQCFFVAVVALVSAGDVNSAQRTDTDSEVLLTFQVVGWIAVAGALSSIMLGYVGPKGHASIVGTLTERERSAAPPEMSSTESPQSPDLPCSDLSSAAGETSRTEGEIRSLPDWLNSQSRIHRGDPSTAVLSPGGGGQGSAQEALRLHIDKVRQRLQDEVQSLTTRGNLNLIIGSITSLAAVTILWILVLNAPSSGLTTGALLGYYLPRLSLALFIEVFSFFFLRLYRTGLADIKYYQNEITTVESRLLALEVAILAAREESIDVILSGLSSLDRNVILKQGESTTELERLRIDQQNLRSLLDGVVARLPSLGKQ